jgi:uncharacterized protein YjbI with pentapeptide repeats
MDARLADAQASGLWFSTEGREGAPVQWIGEDLAGIDLRQAVLVESCLLGTSLRGARLDGADFARAVAGGAVFDDCKGRDARFAKSELTEARFVGADLTGATFLKATLESASFERATLDGALLDGANCTSARFVAATLRLASLSRADLSGADLSGADLTGASFVDTRVDAALRLDGCVGLVGARVESILVGPSRLAGHAARAWLAAQASRAPWAVADLELWLLAKMSGAGVAGALQQLGATADDMARVAGELGATLDQPAHAAAEYRRILGRPNTTRLIMATGAFAGSLRCEYILPLWSDMVFVVNEDPRGMAWGVSFEGGAPTLPDELSSIQAWHWSAERLRREAISTEVEEEWSYDLEAVLTFPPGPGARRFRARFDLGLLQSWKPTDPA